MTDSRIGTFETLAQKDDGLTVEAREKVGQAKSDAAEATKQVEKAIQEVKAIMDELNSLQEINTNDLDKLGKCDVRRLAFREQHD